MSSESLHPIDAVITWVDGQDPKHIQKLNHYLAQIGGHRPRTADPTRFHNDDEITYCVVSLLRYAPWLRYIYIVTDDQVPDVLRQIKNTSWAPRVKLIDHKDIFAGYEHALPTFNIRSIMTVLWRIPDLAERFIFLNDDFMLIQPVTPEQFFHDGGIVVRGEWRPLQDKRWKTRLRRLWFALVPKTQKQIIHEKVKHRDAQKNTARLAGFTEQYLFLNHEPHPWRKSTTGSFFENNPALLTSNILPKLRSNNQFITEALAAFLEVKAGTAKIDNSLKTLEIDPPKQTEFDIKEMIRRADSDQSYAFACVQSIEMAAPELRAYIKAWLDKRVGTLNDVMRSECREINVASNSLSG